MQAVVQNDQTQNSVQSPFNSESSATSSFQYSTNGYRQSSKAFTCERCPKSYKYKNGLAAHVKFECGKTQQFNCPYCGYLMRYKQQLRSHIRTKHDLLMVVCPLGRGCEIR